VPDSVLDLVPDSVLNPVPNLVLNSVPSAAPYLATPLVRGAAPFTAAEAPDLDPFAVGI
jgi:hypothetical protein